MVWLLRGRFPVAKVYRQSGTSFKHVALLVIEMSRQDQNFRIIPRILFSLYNFCSRRKKMSFRVSVKQGLNTFFSWILKMTGFIFEGNSESQPPTSFVLNFENKTILMDINILQTFGWSKRLAAMFYFLFRIL